MSGKYKVRSDRILFVDLEITCWDGPPPQGQEPEIIEIGLAELSVDSFDIVRSASLLVRPEYSEVSDYCENLTGLSASKLRKEGRYLKDIAPGLKKNWGSGSKAWMSWGSDKAAVIRDFAKKGVVNPFSEAFHDIGLQFTLMSGAQTAVGLTEALRLLGLEREGRIHSGEADAVESARAWVAMARLVRTQIAPNLVEATSPLLGGGR